MEPNQTEANFSINPEIKNPTVKFNFESTKPSDAVIPVSEVSERSFSPVPDFTPEKQQNSVNIADIRAKALTLQDQVNNLATSSTKPDYAQQYLETATADLSGEKQTLRDEAGLVEKEARARELSNRIIERDRDYQEQLEALEQNQEGKLRGALNAEINDLQRNRSRELADLSFAFQVAQGDFTAAQTVVDQRIEDMEADRDRRMNAFQMAYNFSQDDMSESEKLEAQQAFQVQMKQMDQAYQKEMADYRERLARGRIDYENSLKASNLLQPQDQLAVAGEVGDINSDLALINQLASNTRGLGASTGAVQSAGISGFFQGGKSDDSYLSTLFRFVPGVGNIKGAADSVNDKQDFLSGISFLVNSTTFNEVLELKQGGVTFGNMTEGERIAAGRAANRLNASVDIDPNGTVIGIRGSEDKFREDLQLVQDAFEAKKEAVLIGSFLSPQEQLQILNE